MHRLPLSLTSFLTLAAIACGDGPVGIEVGDAMEFQERTDERYDCAPGSSPDPVDPAVCGSRTDTVTLPGYSTLEARLTVNEVRNTTPQPEPGDPAASVVHADRLQAGGELTLSRCSDPDDCEVVFRGEVDVQVDRITRECRGLNTPTECGGRDGGTVVLVIVALEGLRGPVLLTGVQDESGLIQGESERSLFPPSRELLRSSWSLRPE